MRQRDRDLPVTLETHSDALGDAPHTEQPARCEAADDDGEPGLQQLEFPVAPERAQLLLARRRRPVAPSGRSAPRVAARDGRAVEGGIKGVLVHVEPAAQRPAGPAAPGTPLLSLLHSGRLAEHVRPLARVRENDGQRFERVAGLGACAADSVVALERGDRAIARAATGHACTTTNQSPACITLPPSSCASSSGSKTRLYTVQREPSFNTRSSQREACSHARRMLPTTTSARAMLRACSRKRTRSGSSRWQ